MSTFAELLSLTSVRAVCAGAGNASMRHVLSLALALASTACARGAADEHADHPAPSPAASASARVAGPGTDPSIPPSADYAQARLAASTRHAEWVTIRTSAAGGDSVPAWIVFPERATKAPVVVVIHEIFGLSTWVRAVADRLAADGFIAIAPDFLTGRMPFSPSGPNPDSARAAIVGVRPEEVVARVAAAGEYATRLPAASDRYGVIGFCWGGRAAFFSAIGAAGIDAAVVYYGASPGLEWLPSIQAPVLGLYGERDQRVNSTIAPADSALRALGKSYTARIFAGAGHGFLRQQADSTGANFAASSEAWPMTLAFFRRHLGS